MVQVMLPDQTVAQLEQSAARRGLDTTQLLIKLVEEYLGDELALRLVVGEDSQQGQQQKIAQEQQYYEAQHAVLFSEYEGQYIAMHEGKVVDHDTDRVALSRRIRSSYGKTPVLITQVREEPRLTITVRSPRFVKTKR